LTERIGELEKFKDKPIIVCCASGMRSNKACAELKKQGFAKLLQSGGWCRCLGRCRISGQKGSRQMSVAVLMYTTAVCPFCIRAKQLLEGAWRDEIEEVRIDLDPERRDEMMLKTKRRTVPQIFIGDTHVGGCDDLYALDAAGKLMPLLDGNCLKPD
jgi:glutaredoxin 3